MASTIGVNLKVTGDSSGAKRAFDDVNSSVVKLTQNAKPLNTLLGGTGNQQPVQRLNQPNNNYGIPGGTLLDSRGMPMYQNTRTWPTLTESAAGMNNPYGRQAPASLLSADGKKNVEGEQKIVRLTDRIEELNDIMQQVSDKLWDAHDRGDVLEEQKLASTLKNLKETETMMRRQRREEDKEEGGKGSGKKSTGNYIAGMMANKVVESFLSAGNTLRSSQTALAGGDYMGSIIGKEKGMGGLVGGGIGTLVGLLGFLGGPALGMATTMAGGQIGKFFGEEKGHKLEVANEYSKKYEAALPSIDKFYQRFGKDIETKTGGQNASEGLAWYNKAARASYGTGHTTDDMIQAAAVRGTYGNFSGDQALKGARDDILWERFTGANLSNVQRLSGTAKRYGGDDNAVNAAYAELTASGMGKGQFDEFLTSMQRIMEDGIEKGFVRGADEIAGNMTLLSKLSGGNALWTGEQGANRLMRMNDAVSNATGLKSVEDVLSFGVANELANKGDFKKLTGYKNDALGNYIDTQMILEKGVNKDLLRGQFSEVNRIAGGSSAAAIEHFMKMYNLNYTGGREVYDMMKGSERWTDKDWQKAETDIKKFQKTPGYQSDSQKLQDVLTRLDTTLVNIGKIEFDATKIPHLNEMAEDLHLIYLKYLDIIPMSRFERKYLNREIVLGEESTTDTITRKRLKNKNSNDYQSQLAALNYVFVEELSEKHKMNFNDFDDKTMEDYHQYQENMNRWLASGDVDLNEIKAAINWMIEFFNKHGLEGGKDAGYFGNNRDLSTIYAYVTERN